MIEQTETINKILLWQTAVQAAVNERDPTMLEARTRTAETAIFQRIRDFSSSPGFGEEQALFDALDTLRSLRSASPGPKC